MEDAVVEMDAVKYLNSIKNGDIISANKLCEEELISSNVNISEGVSDRQNNDIKFYCFKLSREWKESSFSKY